VGIKGERGRDRYNGEGRVSGRKRMIWFGLEAWARASFKSLGIREEGGI